MLLTGGVPAHSIRNAVAGQRVRGGSVRQCARIVRVNGMGGRLPKGIELQPDFGGGGGGMPGLGGGPPMVR
jgi:hypothetical protein